MLNALTIILCCQLAGELFVAAIALPVPGPVCGMAMMFFGLILRGGVPQPLSDVADAILGNLSLLFIPAGVGVMLHLQLMSSEALPISVALIVSTLVTIAVTGWIMRWANRWSAAANREGDADV